MKTFGLNRELLDKHDNVNNILINDNESERCQNNIMGHKKHFQQVKQDLRSISLPNCLIEQQFDINGCSNSIELLEYRDNNSLQIQGSDQWFKTWPERCEKIKIIDSNIINTHNSQINCDKNKNGFIKNDKITFSSALQNISLAYSPITKQLHLIENKPKNNDELIVEKKCHKRNEGCGSFSSTISSLSDPSSSGSLLDVDSKSLTSVEDFQLNKKGFSRFFNGNVFSWKSGSNIWKFFRKPLKNNLNGSPHHIVSSSALIQNSRPSNLPAKTEEEEQRHREEYKVIVAAAKKKEAQNTVAKQKLQKLQLLQEEHHASVSKHFMLQVIPNWDIMRHNKKTKDLWWQGLPSSVRGKVWRLAIGNELNVTQQLYEICLSRAQNHLNSPEIIKKIDIDQESSLDVIQLDISRTFPNLCIFQEGGPYSDILHSLLAAYVCYRPDVGYVQGMSFIAAILILNMEPYDAFICFANLLNQPLHLSAFTLNQVQMQAYYQAYNEIFSYNLPKLFKHFENSGLSPDLYLLDWIYTIFAKSMPLDVACRVWDNFLRDGYEFIFRTALGILHLNQDTLLEMDFLHGSQFLTRLPDDLSSDQLFKSIQSVTTTIGKSNFYQIVDKCTFSLITSSDTTSS